MYVAKGIAGYSDDLEEMEFEVLDDAKSYGKGLLFKEYEYNDKTTGHIQSSAIHTVTFWKAFYKDNENKQYKEIEMPEERIITNFTWLDTLTKATTAIIESELHIWAGYGYDPIDFLFKDNTIRDILDIGYIQFQGQPYVLVQTVNRGYNYNMLGRPSLDEENSKNLFFDPKDKWIKRLCQHVFNTTQIR